MQCIKLTSSELPVRIDSLRAVGQGGYWPQVQEVGKYGRTEAAGLIKLHGLISVEISLPSRDLS